MDSSKSNLKHEPSSQIILTRPFEFETEDSDNLNVKASFGCQITTAATMDFVRLTRRFFSLKNALIREFLSEIISTFILISFGCGSVAQMVLAPKNKFNSFLSVNFSWGIAVTLGILVGGKVSGAHMNPAVTLSMLIMGNISILKFFIYVIGQSIGALLGSVMVYVVYLDALNAHDGGHRQVVAANATAGIWATYPEPYLSTGGAFFDQFFGTLLLIICILALGDDRNHDISAGTKAYLAGNVVLMIGLAFGMNCGYAINPVRDFIPRLFTSFSGWGVQVFQVGNYYFWIPIFAPLLGSIVATFLYAFMISNHWPNDTKNDFN